MITDEHVVQNIYTQKWGKHSVVVLLCMYLTVTWQYDMSTLHWSTVEGSGFRPGWFIIGWILGENCLLLFREVLVGDYCCVIQMACVWCALLAGGCGEEHASVSALPDGPDACAGPRQPGSVVRQRDWERRAEVAEWTQPVQQVEKCPSGKRQIK